MTHPITPPFELVAQWTEKAEDCEGAYEIDIATQAAQWGADQELEACCAEVLWQEGSVLAAKLRDRRRPKPPSLKESALNALEHILRHSQTDHGANTIRRALKALPND